MLYLLNLDRWNTQYDHNNNNNNNGILLLQRTEQQQQQIIRERALMCELLTMVQNNNNNNKQIEPTTTTTTTTTAIITEDSAAASARRLKERVLVCEITLHALQQQQQKQGEEHSGSSSSSSSKSSTKDYYYSQLTECVLGCENPMLRAREYTYEQHMKMRALGWAMPMVYVGDVQGVGFSTRWTSQAKQDKTVFHLFKGKRDGYFIDLAANDAVSLSNTLTLERDYGWRGLCIEANPMYFEQLYLRNCQVVQAVVGKHNNEHVDFKFNDVIGGVVGSAFDNNNNNINDNDNDNNNKNTKLQATVSIAHIFQTLAVPSVIDYMSLDIEGAEEWVFETFPWSNHAILLLTVERPKKRLVHLLMTHGYSYVCDHGDFGDQMWIHSSFPEWTSAVAGLRLSSLSSLLGEEEEAGGGRRTQQHQHCSGIY